MRPSATSVCGRFVWVNVVIQFIFSSYIYIHDIHTYYRERVMRGKAWASWSSDREREAVREVLAWASWSSDRASTSCLTAALLLLYYCFAAALLLFNYCFTTHTDDSGTISFVELSQSLHQFIPNSYMSLENWLEIVTKKENKSQRLKAERPRLCVKVMRAKGYVHHTCIYTLHIYV